MEFKRHLIPYTIQVPRPEPGMIASNSVEALSPEDIEVDLYAALFLDAQGKLPSIEELLAELRADPG